MNFGAAGAMIGHEMTHGFDDSGRRFDPKGNLMDWWTPRDDAAFRERASCVASQYSNYASLPGVKLNGNLTLGENVADNGGLRIAHHALMELLSTKGPQPAIDGFTPEQRFFIACGQVWCENATDQDFRPPCAGRRPRIGTLARQRRAAEHAGVPQSVRLQGRRADGARQRLSSVVDDSGSCSSSFLAIGSRYSQIVPAI